MVSHIDKIWLVDIDSNLVGIDKLDNISKIKIFQIFYLGEGQVLEMKGGK